MSIPSLYIYAIFHLNLAYSSIEEEQRPDVIRRCYWPLLHLARDHNLPFGIEASGYTLETAAAIDPTWLNELRYLITEGPCEFIGSGYAQIIGPLVPAEVNTANLRLGHQVYEQLLGFRPQIALINEQAYSYGLVQLYLDAHYQAIIMEWNNPARYHLDWPRNWHYLPQRACGSNGETIPVIWNDAIAFQKFQRYAHGELELDEYLDYLGGLLLNGGPADISAGIYAFPLYGNDIEIFDFRPGRYSTEGDIHPEGEWARIRRLLEILQGDPRFKIIPPSQVLTLLDYPDAGHRLHLESPEQPIPVKKQEKYNVSRWAVTGRDNVAINTECWRLYRALRTNLDTPHETWRALCYLWSSDFRTHITAARWQAFWQQLMELECQVSSHLPPSTAVHEAFSENRVRDNKEETPTHNGLLNNLYLGAQPFIDLEHPRHHICRSPSHASLVQRQGRFLIVETEAVKVRLNCRRGLAIDALWFKEIADEPLVGTLAHGYYTDIALGADYYTGNTIVEIPGCHRVTDLNPAEPNCMEMTTGEGAVIQVCAQVSTELGPVVKTLDISLQHPCVGLSYVFEWHELPQGIFRTGIVTLIPTAFERKTLFYSTHNGGYNAEHFPLEGRTLLHGEPASTLVSARQGLGATEGIIMLGDANRSIQVTFNPAQAAAMPMLLYREVDGHYFLRLLFSLRELDDTQYLWRRRPIASLIYPGVDNNADMGTWKLGMERPRHGCCNNQALCFSISIMGKKGSENKDGPIAI